MFQLQLFGYFALKKDDCILDENSLHSNILLKLLVYLVLNRHKNVSNAELERALWKTGEIDSPQDALKNLIYRLRSILAKNFGEKDYILTQKGFYKWNDTYEITVDVELFEKQAEEILQEIKQHAYNQSLLQKTIDTIALYQGMFLPNKVEDFWISSLYIKYHTQYLTLVENLFSYYWDKEEYKAADELISKALNIDSRDERLNVHKIQILKKLNLGNLAEKFYFSVEKSLNKSMDLQGAKLLRRLKQEMVQSVPDNTITIPQLKREVADILEGKKGPLMCGYSDFKILYAQQVKKTRRTKEESYVILFQVRVGEQSTKQVQDFFLDYAMTGLEEVLTHNLREIDVIARCGQGQFIILLDKCSYENAIKLVNRLNRKYKESYDTKFVEIAPDIQRLT